MPMLVEFGINLADLDIGFSMPKWYFENGNLVLYVYLNGDIKETFTFTKQ